MMEFFVSLSERGKLFLVMLACSITAILLSLLIGGWWSTSVVIIPAILSILQVTKGVWAPEAGAKSKVAIISLGVALAAIISGQLWWRAVVDPLLEPLYELVPALKGKVPSGTPSVAALLFLAAVILIVNYFARDTTAMGEHPTAVEKEFPEKDYRKLLESFCSLLLSDLNDIDRQSNWSAEIFTPLDAEVEVKSGTRRVRRVMDLLKAIRSDRRSRVFLVLGDPGSGKSVALRKLCRDLLREVKKTGKVPLYVNLREWETIHPWSETSPPTVGSLYGFVLSNLKARGDVFTNEFLDKYFKKMFENGRLFLVLDSFDEIPSVLDVNERSWLIDTLSDVIYRFLGGAHESRGVLASRIFRRPTERFDATTTLEIRPFTESKIVESLKKSMLYDDSLVSALFKERPELVPIARNPFTAALISSYAKTHDNALPQNQSELYSTYITRRLDASTERIQKAGLTNAEVVSGAVEIADAMLKTQQFGLEASIGDLKQRIPTHRIEDIVSVLDYARLGRIGGGGERRFSFVHRRFNEYFVVQRLIRQPQQIPRDAIPTDSRWRDALVLYCEVADEREVRQIAEFCWSEVRALRDQTLDLRDPQYIRGIHCLRFLREAFRGRTHCISSFRPDLAGFIMDQIEREDSLLSLKLALEAVGLLETKDIDLALVKALEINNPWVNETAFRSCHYLPALSKHLSERLRLSIEAINLITFLKQRHEIAFSLRLSNIFSDLRAYCNWRTADCYLLPLVFILAVALSKSAVAITITMLVTAAIPGILVLSGFFAPSPDLEWRSLQTKLLNRSLLLRTFAFAPLFFTVMPRLTPPRSPGTYSISGAILVATLGLPWYQVYFYLIPSIPLLRSRHLLLAVRRLVLLLVAWLVSSYGLPWLSQRSQMLSYIILGGSLFVTVPLFLWLLTEAARSRWHDYRYFSGIRKKGTPRSRQDISQQFLQLRTAQGRLRYVQFIRREGIQPTGTWPMGKIPNASNDASSTLLAQLEERWLGLDK